MLHFGRVHPSGHLEQVKGVTYKLDRFLEPGSLDKFITYNSHDPNEEGTITRISSKDSMVETDVTSEKEPNDLFHVILYLAPGDYHHFHSPVEWTVQQRRHFPGVCVCVSVQEC